MEEPRQNEKIKTLNELSSMVSSLKRHDKTIVLCHGVFDLLHIGHIRYLEQARRMGDILIVTLTPDEFVDKGPGCLPQSRQHRHRSTPRWHALARSTSRPDPSPQPRC